MKLNFDARGYAFEAGSEVLRQGYASASKALTADIERVRAAHAAYDASPEFIGERDDEGNILWEQGAILTLEQETVEEALEALRNAFVLALYHHWERAIRAYTGSDQNAKYRQLVARAERKGIPAVPDMAKVYRLANTLKHNSGHHGAVLFELWRDLFGPFFSARPDSDWYRAISLSDDDIHEVMRIIGAAGPKVWPYGKPFPLSVSES
ncbi:hypothetical protein [Mesorhizobium sp.]|uniref:hypothetical protein n=1 Tax=Mesorhizobium sp. TaxID=1871066 RepID=UPI000FE8E742|nr:hypothetical protein [Mesorhizobium sp.]RWK63513.1 MAG: hypothetical protein EOR49_09410 [Mesorhizobium sp.]RWM51453.1 MAG: hypothetical protein EOR76_05685 [Mesorhizobium sp.]RWM59633.1 MAG: hypothetical protein EOR78_04195 [Mesorhizobium sp.]RWM60229.1 MAG: hypothetical protein EOR79_07965 [Mesorhizobium sp.]RWN03296.1 MAG: hypothetical protein EOR85_10415 [Mesorhizobium sp.]